MTTLGFQKVPHENSIEKNWTDAQIPAQRFWSDPSCGSCLLDSSGEREYEGEGSDLGNTRMLIQENTIKDGTKDAVFLAEGLTDRGTTDARNPEGEARFTQEDRKLNFGYFECKEPQWSKMGHSGVERENPGECQRLGNHHTVTASQ